MGQTGQLVILVGQILKAYSTVRGYFKVILFEFSSYLSSFIIIFPI